MIILHGIGLGGGISIGNAYILERGINDAVMHSIEKKDLNLEIERFNIAIKEARKDLRLLKRQIPRNAPKELISFISVNIMMLKDRQIALAPIKIIKEEGCNSEWAIKLQAERLSEQFDKMEDTYLKERKIDVLQVLNRIYKNLEGNRFDWEKDGRAQNGILVANDLSPADLLGFKNSNFSGFITQVGNLTSHTAIVGRNLEIPAIVGLKHCKQIIRDDELLIVDGELGILIINPEPKILEQYKKIQNDFLINKNKLMHLKNAPSVTLDGVNIDLLLNVDDVNDLNDIKNIKSSGIGLFRSEFLYLGNEINFASEEEQFKAYKKAAKYLSKNPIIIRTADLGVDKNPNWNIDNSNCKNPALSLTGIRFSLKDQQLFRTQLRAILRASQYGNVQIMFPMISGDVELKQAISHLNYVKEELKEEKIPFNNKIKIGAMIEIPSSAIAIDGILSQVDFVSIGTNDLIQYLLAIDRNDEEVSYLYNPLHPAVLKVIYDVVSKCNKKKIPVSICGEMAQDKRLIRLLLGIGVLKFSIYNSNLLAIKNIVLKTKISSIKSIVKKILNTYDVQKIEALIDKLNIDLEI